MTKFDKVKTDKVRKVNLKNPGERFCAVVWEVDDEVKFIFDTEDESATEDSKITYNSEMYYLCWFDTIEELRAVANTNKVLKDDGFYWDETW
jgi:hypothetical protein